MQLCKVIRCKAVYTKPQYHPLLLEKAAPKPLSTDLYENQNKAAYQTPKYFQLSKKSRSTFANNRAIKPVKIGTKWIYRTGWVTG